MLEHKAVCTHIMQVCTSVLEMYGSRMEIAQQSRVCMYTRNAYHEMCEQSHRYGYSLLQYCV